MSIVINMSSYEIERDAVENEYDEEVMHASWNPTVALACQQQLCVPANKRMAMPADLAAVDAELFLQKMCTYQR